MRKSITLAAKLLAELGLATTELGEQTIARVKELAHHRLYREIRSVEDARTFMEMHVWCVWDFMSLAKAVQLGVGHYAIPWLPPRDASLVHAINEIISGEEADEVDWQRRPDGRKRRLSHFEIYLEAMRHSGASTACIDRFIELLRDGANVDSALAEAGAPDAAATFVRSTLDFATGPLHRSVAAFCLSREDLVPAMFVHFISNLPEHEPRLQPFRWYVDRHIALDSDSHGPLSGDLLSGVLGDDPARRDDALTAALEAINARRTYLDASLEEVIRRRTTL